MFQDCLTHIEALCPPGATRQLFQPLLNFLRQSYRQHDSCLLLYKYSIAWFAQRSCSLKPCHSAASLRLLSKPQPENESIRLTHMPQSIAPLLLATPPASPQKVAPASNACSRTIQSAASKIPLAKPSPVSEISAAVPTPLSHPHPQQLQATPRGSQIEMRPARPALAAPVEHIGPLHSLPPQ